MDGVFAFLWVLSLACLVVGLVSPKIFEKLFKKHTNRKIVGITFASLLIVFFVLTGITSGAPHTTQNPALPNTIKPTSNVISPTITSKTTTTTQPITFTTITEQNATLAKGTTTVKTRGVNGLQTQTWTVTYSNGVETGRKLVSTVTTTQPVNEVVEQGTYVAPAPTPTSSQTSIPTPTPSAPSCYPLTNGGNCYEPGEYCRTSDHGASGVAGNGESITCTDNNGWRWEPN